MNEDKEIDDYVAQLVAEAPPLTREQRARLVVLLRPVRIAASSGGVRAELAA